MRRTWIFLFVWVVATLPVACGLFLDTDGLTGGGGATEDALAADVPLPPIGDAEGVEDAEDVGDASDVEDAGDASTGCPAGRGPSMVDLGAFCIDSTEVTQAQYQAFLAAADKPAQPAVCNWNANLVPKSTGDCLWDPTGYPDLPVSCVDWCDAWSFCEWAGKRLCGAIDGGSLSLSDYASNEGQWAFACSRGGARAYPYGPDYDGEKGCNGADAAAATSPYIVAAGSRAGCVGGFDGIHDMSGNVKEWIDACGACDAGRCCSHVGGAYLNSLLNLACVPPNNGAVVAVESSIDVLTGLRCCSR